MRTCSKPDWGKGLQRSRGDGRLQLCERVRHDRPMPGGRSEQLDNVDLDVTVRQPVRRRTRVTDKEAPHRRLIIIGGSDLDEEGLRA
jgi:hypothetical protein